MGGNYCPPTCFWSQRHTSEASHMSICLPYLIDHRWRNNFATHIQSISVAFEHCVLRVVVAKHKLVVNSFTDCHGKGSLIPRPSHLQYLIAYSMQIQRGKAWEISSHGNIRNTILNSLFRDGHGNFKFAILMYGQRGYNFPCRSLASFCLIHCFCMSPA